MIWESEGSAAVQDRVLPGGISELESPEFEPGHLVSFPARGIEPEARDEELDEFEDFDEEDFDDEFDDDFEEEQDEEYEAENEEYPDNDFGTGADIDEDLEEIEIDPDIDADFDDAVPAVEPADVEDDEGDVDVVDAD